MFLAPSINGKLTLPEGEEDDWLDGEELEDGVEGLEEVPRREVEEEQRVQRQRDRRVVDQGDVHVALGRTGMEKSGTYRSCIPSVFNSFKLKWCS